MTQARLGWQLRAYLWAAKALPWIARRILLRRLKAGKELPDRWEEKLGQATAPRPDGPLIWLHGVGLGEVLALRGLVAALSRHDPNLSFLLTSTTAKSADAIAAQLPPRTQHQFLPIDSPVFVDRFLAHWSPDLAIWTDQDLWPGMAVTLHHREIPQAIIAGRITEKSYQKRRRFRAAYADIYGLMARVQAQDAATCAYLKSLGATQATIGGSLKPAAPPLDCDVDELTELQATLRGRFVWIVAASHPADDARALDAHALIRQENDDALLIIAPRFPDRAIQTGLPTATRTSGEIPTAEHAVWIADTTGEMGLFYRLAKAAYIGGSNDDTEGHNPWEAIALNVPVFHGPRTANFRADYQTLDDTGAAQQVTDPVVLAELILQDSTDQRAKAQLALATARAQTDAVAGDLITLLDRQHD